jgi:polysaccharide biosynthesis transport protein
MRTSTLTTQQLFAALRGRRGLIAAVWLTVVLAVLALSLLLPRQYAAQAAVVIDLKAPEMLSNPALSAGWLPGYVATQVDVMNSERVVLKAIDALGLQRDPLIHERWREDTDGQGDLAVWLANRIQKKLDVQASREGNALYVAYTGRDAKASADIVNAVIEGYIDLTLEMRVEPTRQFSRFFDERSASLRQQLDAAQARLSAFQKENGIVAAEERYDVETARLAELNSQLTIAQQQAVETTGRRVQAQTDPARAADVLNNPQVAALNAELSRQQVRLRELSSRLGDQHPQVIETTASLAELRQALAAASRQAGSGLAGNDAVTRQRVAALESAVDAQRAKVLRSKELRDRVAALQRDVDSAQKALDFVLTRSTQTSLESQNTQTNVTVVKRATPPTRATSPSLGLNLMLGMIAGLLLGCVAALVVESFDRRLRTTEDLEVDLQTTVFGTLIDTGPALRPNGSATSPALRALPAPMASAARALPAAWRQGLALNTRAGSTT